MPPADEPQNPEYPEGEAETLRLLRDALTKGRELTIAEELEYLLTPPPMVREHSIRAMREGRRGPTVTASRYREMAAKRREARLYIRFRKLLPNARRGKAIPLPVTVDDLVESVIRDPSIRPHKWVKEIVRRMTRAGLPNCHERTIRNWIKRRIEARKLSI